MNKLTDMIREIDLIHNKINTHPEYSEMIKRRVKFAINRSSLDGSAKIENSLGEFNELSPRVSDKVYLSRLMSAWKYLSEEGISTNTLIGIPNKIDPAIPARFRNNDKIFAGMFPPNWEKVPYLIDDLIYRLNSDIGIHPIIKSIDAHLEIIRIHPFEDGNSRSGRLISNFLLAGKGYPSYIISENEKDLYFFNLKPALLERYDNKTSVSDWGRGNLAFGVYISRKILESSKLLKRELDHKRIYELKLNNNGHRKIKAGLSHYLHNCHNNSHGKIKISSSKKNRDNHKYTFLTLTGDVGERDLKLLLSKFMLNSSKIKYSLKIDY